MGRRLSIKITPRMRKDRKRRQEADKGRMDRMLLKAKRINERLTYKERSEAKKLLDKRSRNESAVRIRNRCVQTGNPRSVRRKYRISGLRVRELGRAGRIPGLYKKSW